MAYLTGFHAIEERLRAGKAGGPLLVSKPGPRAKEIIDLAVEKKIRVERTGTAELDRLARDNRGIALEINDGPASDAGFDELLAGLAEKENAVAVLLDEITDPHNFGAIIRSCDQFGADLIVARTARSAKNSDVIAKASAGAVSWAPLCFVPNLVRAVSELKESGFWIYGADADGKDVRTADLRGRAALILGSEGAGISRLLREQCDGIVAVPSRGRVDSLNVSVACGVLLYELLRQRDEASANGGGRT